MSSRAIRLRNGSHVLLDFDTEWDLARAKRLHEAGDVEVSEPLSETVDEAREELTDALQIDEMMRTKNESSSRSRGINNSQ